MWKIFTLSFSLPLSVSLHHSSLGSLFWETPLWDNFSCLVVILCRRHGDIKHSGVFSWEQPCCDQGNKLNIRRWEAVCHRWEWREWCREGLCVLPPAGEWRLAEEMLSEVLQPHKSTENRNDRSSCISVENEQSPSRGWNEEPTVSWDVWAGNQTSRTLHEGVLCMQPKCFTSG